MPRVVDTQQRRAELTDATAHAIAKVGIENVTLREIARSGGWTTGIVNHYFADKRDLMRATFRSRADIARARVERSVEAGASLLEAIIDASLPLDAERLLNWKVWLAFWGAAVGDEELSAAQRERHATFLGSIEDALGAEVEAGRLRGRLDLAHEARRLLSVLDGIAVQVVFEPRRWPAAEQRRIVDDHLASLAPARSARR